MLPLRSGLARLTAMISLLALGALTGCAGMPVSADVGQAPIGSIAVTQDNGSIVLARLRPLVAAALERQLGLRYAPGRGARLTVVLRQADIRTSSEIEETTGAYGDELTGSVTLTSAGGAVLVQDRELLAQSIRITLDRSYGVPSTPRLGRLADAFANAVAGRVGS